MTITQRTVKTIRLEWITLWNAIKAFLGDKPLVSAVAAIIVMFIVARDPSLAPKSDAIQNAILVLAGLVVGTYKLVDIITAIAGVYTAKTSANLVVSANTAALNSATGAIRALNDTTTAAVGARLLAPVAPRTTDVHTPQQPDPARNIPGVG